jgi:cytochrome c553
VGAVAFLAAALVSSALAADVALCAACHGPQGNSAVPTNPSLAGQPKQFITTQLVMFREGNRKDPQMSPIAANLTNAEVNELGAYFASQEPVPPPPSDMDPAKVAASQRLASQYNCVVCHGAALKGTQHIPRLAGQQRVYLAEQLRGFKAGKRFDMDGNMTSAAKPLTAEDIELLAEYLAALR